MINAIAVDDEIASLDVISFHASKVPFIDLKAQFVDALKALDYLQTEQVDLIFLDIKMPDISGIDFFRSLNRKPLVIFTTAYAEHAVTSFELDAVDYLLKPFSLARFIKACNKANEYSQFKYRGEKNNFLFLKVGYELIKVLFGDICYLEAAGNYINFVMRDKSYLSRMTFSKLEELLPEKMFVRVHRSFIVGIEHIERIERHQISVLGTKIPIGASFMEQLLALANKY